MPNTPLHAWIRPTEAGDARHARIRLRPRARQAEDRLMTMRKAHDA